MLSLLQKTLTTRTEALIITRNNIFLGEDLRADENKIEALTGFTGSAGLLLITKQKAFLFVDGRYAIQARAETDCAKVQVIDAPVTLEKSMIEQCRALGIQRLFYDPWCLSVREVECLTAQGFELVSKEDEILPKHFGQARLFEHLPIYSGEVSAKKCADVLKSLPDEAEGILICAADEVSWLSNLRSDSLEYTPILRAFALLTRSNGLEIFSDDVQDKCIEPLKALQTALARQNGHIIYFDKGRTPQKVLDLKPENLTFKAQEHDVIATMKCRKNAVELKGFRQAHLRDGVAVTKFLYWLDHQTQPIDELGVVAKLHEFRAGQSLFVSESFGTIAAAGAHAAIVHYQPTAQTNMILPKDSLLLLDSGGQYLDGTTDVTRTISIGTPSKEMQTSFTLVLKAHLALASHRFSIGTTGESLDLVARSVLRAYGLDYAHGTGHGVGHFSNVHEGPFRISPRCLEQATADMVVSIEPGVYLENKYGIRIENLVYTKKDNTGMLYFENLTLIPIDKCLINTHLLSVGEKEVLNAYHQKVFENIAPYLEPDESAWLQEACSPL